MFTLLSFIFLGLILALIIGLIRPFRYLPMSKTKPTRKSLGITFGGLIIVCFILLSLNATTTKTADTSMKTSSNPSKSVPKDTITPIVKTVAKTTPTQTTATPKPQYRIAYNDDNDSVQNIFVAVDPSGDKEDFVKSISLNVEKTVCTKQCNIDIFDDASAL